MFSPSNFIVCFACAHFYSSFNCMGFIFPPSGSGFECLTIEPKQRQTHAQWCRGFFSRQWLEDRLAPLDPVEGISWIILSTPHQTIWNISGKNSTFHKHAFFCTIPTANERRLFKSEKNLFGLWKGPRGIMYLDFVLRIKVLLDLVSSPLVLWSSLHHRDGDRDISLPFALSLPPQETLSTVLAKTNTASCWTWLSPRVTNRSRSPSQGRDFSISPFSRESLRGPAFHLYKPVLFYPQVLHPDRCIF